MLSIGFSCVSFSKAHEPGHGNRKTSREGGCLFMIIMILFDYSACVFFGG